MSPAKTTWASIYTTAASRRPPHAGVSRRTTANGSRRRSPTASSAAGRPDDLYTFIPDLNVVNRFEGAGRDAVRAQTQRYAHRQDLGNNFARVFREVWGA